MKVKSNVNHLEKLSGKPCFDLKQSLGILQQNAIGAEIPECGDRGVTQFAVLVYLTPSNRWGIHRFNMGQQRETWMRTCREGGDGEPSPTNHSVQIVCEFGPTFNAKL
jgi:hypothetical protein